MNNERFDGFEYTAQELSKYLFSPALGLFTILLKQNKQTIHYTPDHPEEFKRWLEENNIPTLNMR